MILPHYQIPLTLRDGKAYCFDPLRKKKLVFTPEESVRQRLIRYLLEDIAYPPALIAVERALQYNNLMKRFDLIGYDRAGRPLLLAECKRPDVPINEAVLRQVALYNFSYKAPFLLLTNGETTVAFEVSADGGGVLETLPSFETLCLRQFA